MGVLVAPKDENAPVPRPKFAPPGEASPDPGVVTGLKGFLPPCDELSPPNRLEEKEGFRSPWPELEVERESLLVLLIDFVSESELRHHYDPSGSV